MSNPAIVSVRSEIDDIRDCLAGGDIDSLPHDYPTYQMARDRMDELQRLREALIKICDRAHKPQVGVVSESFDIAITEAKTLLNMTMPRPPYREQ